MRSVDRGHLSDMMVDVATRSLSSFFLTTEIA